MLRRCTFSAALVFIVSGVSACGSDDGGQAERPLPANLPSPSPTTGPRKKPRPPIPNPTSPPKPGPVPVPSVLPVREVALFARNPASLVLAESSSTGMLWEGNCVDDFEISVSVYKVILEPLCAEPGALRDGEPLVSPFQPVEGFASPCDLQGNTRVFAREDLSSSFKTAHFNRRADGRWCLKLDAPTDFLWKWAVPE